jgi:hypothetical protein
MPEYRMGNLLRDDFWSVWNGDRYRYCRRLVARRRGDASLGQTMCHDCTGVYPGQATRRYWG